MSFSILDRSIDLSSSLLLEASAGTGKTFAIEHLVVRQLLSSETVTIDRISVVTFTKAAARELRARIHSNLVEAIGRLDRSEGSGWDYLDALVEAGEEVHSQARGRLQRALAAFDSALIETIHGFCTRFLGSCGFAGGIGLELQPVEERLDRVGQLRLVRDFFRLGLTRGGYTAEELQKMVNSHRGDSERFFEALLQRASGREAVESDPLFGKLAGDLRLFFWRYLEREELLTHDRVIDLMAESLTHPEFLKEVRSRLSFVVVDEFQDTDPAQWAIFRRICEGGSIPLVLVGDPKQSIYAFRHADIYTYLEARSWIGEERCHSLSINYRSCPGLIGGLNALFSEANAPGLFALPRLTTSLPYPPVEPAPGAVEGGKIRFLLAQAEEELFSYIGDRWIEEVELGEKVDGAVLVSRWDQGVRVQAYLQSRGIPSFLARRQSIDSLALFTPFCDLLVALIDPSPHSIRRVVGGRIIGWSPEKVATLTDLRELAPWIDRFTSLRKLWLDSGLCSAVEALLNSLSIGEELLSREGGGRLYSELRQLVERASEWESGHGIAPERLLSAVKGWAQAKEEVAPIPEGEGLQILTIHASKGLEYDLVFALGVADRSLPSKIDPAEGEAEKARLLYVALTRAKRELYIPLPLAKGRGRAPIELLLNREVGIETIVLSGVKSERRMTPPSPQLIPPHPSSLSFSRERVSSYSGLNRREMEQRGGPARGQGERSRHTLPAGVETGILLHDLLEKVDWKLAGAGGEALDRWVAARLALTHLEGWEEVVSQMVHAAFSTPMGRFTLAQVDPSSTAREMEFLFPVDGKELFHGRPVEKGALFGVVDLLFEFEGRSYLVDWKSNWLGGSDAAYEEEGLRGAIEQHDYRLQAAIYRGALERYLRLVDPRPLSESFGGVYYLFLRGLDGKGGRGVIEC